MHIDWSLSPYVSKLAQKLPETFLSWCWDTPDMQHYNDVIMTTMASQITSLTVVYSIVYSGADQRKHQSSASLAFVRGTHRDLWIPAQRTSNAENVSIWWRHHEEWLKSSWLLQMPWHWAISNNHTDFSIVCVSHCPYNTYIAWLPLNKVWSRDVQLVSLFQRVCLPVVTALYM